MSGSPEYMGDELPPPYESLPGETSSLSLSSSNIISGPASSSLFSSHLISLRSQIATEQIARSSAHERNDMITLSLLVPYIEELLSSIADMHPTPKFIETTLVPDTAVDTSWQFSDEEESQRPGEVRSLIRVRQDCKSLGEKGYGEKDEKKCEGVDSQAGMTLWWSDESMARRLARLLQPAARPSQETPAKGTGRWSMFKKEDRSKIHVSKPLGQASTESARSSTQRPDDGVSMSARAEEVTFRRENDFGLWETHTGWGIVVRVRIRYVWRP